MRTITTRKTNYTATITTSDLYCCAYGKNFLNIEFATTSTKIPTLISVEYGNFKFNQYITGNSCQFNLDWFRYFAPKSGTTAIKLTIYGDDSKIVDVNYNLTAKRGEVLVNPKTAVMRDENENAEEYDRTFILEDCYNVSATQFTKHWQNVEMMVYTGDELIFTGVGIGGWGRPIPQGYTSLARNGESFLEIQGTTIFDNKTLERYEFTDNTCHDIEIRITDRNGLRGVMGGKIVDASEGGDDVKSNFDTITPYNGIHHHTKSGQKIQKEVFFDCDGDARLLGLLRDACVYGVAEWYCEAIGQWLPCEVADNSLDTDPFKEQSITFILQQL